MVYLPIPPKNDKLAHAIQHILERLAAFPSKNVPHQAKFQANRWYIWVCDLLVNDCFAGIQTNAQRTI